MARHEIYGSGPTWGQSLGVINQASPNTILYVTATEVGVKCADGTFIYLKGSNFAVTTLNGITTYAGNVTDIYHYSAAGAYIDSLTSIAGASVAEVMTPYTAYTDTAVKDGMTTISNFELRAMAGDDIVDASTRYGNVIVDDKLNGWGGNDKLFGGTGNDRLSGDAGNDILSGDAGNDKLAGGSGDDSLLGGSGNDLLAGGTGNDLLSGGAGTDIAFFLGKFSDLTIAKNGSGFTVTSLEGGTDTLSSVEKIATNDGVFTFDPLKQVWTRTGNADQSLMLADTAATFQGSAGADSFGSEMPGVAQPSLDLVFGGGGDDTFLFKNSYTMQPVHNHGLVYVYGGAGNDVIGVRDNGDYLSTAPSGTFNLYGESGNDNLRGGYSADVLDGGIGNDTLDGGNGNDTLTGGAGADVFAFTNVTAPGKNRSQISGHDVITDFVVGQDHLSFTGTHNIQVSDTAAGLSVTGTADGPGYAVSVLLQGVHGPYSLSDLLLI